MSFERPSSEQEKAPIEMTREQFNAIQKEPGRTEWMQENGIEFDSADVRIMLDGEERLMSTSKEDWGTIVAKPHEG